MKVLEVGCGTGHMAVELAKITGITGEVIACDNSQAQLEIAKEIGTEAGVSNITYLNLDLCNGLTNYKEQFDFIYGRWVLEFTENSKETLKQLFEALKPGGILVYEATDINDPGCFGYPDNQMPEQYNELGKVIWKFNKRELSFIKQSYFFLKEFGALNVDMVANQGIAKTAEEKSVFRLGIESIRELIEEHIMTSESYTTLLESYIHFEQSDNIAGFYRNLLVSGVKPK